MGCLCRLCGCCQGWHKVLAASNQLWARAASQLGGPGACMVRTRAGFVAWRQREQQRCAAVRREVLGRCLGEGRTAQAMHPEQLVLRAGGSATVKL